MDICTQYGGRKRAMWPSALIVCLVLCAALCSVSTAGANYLDGPAGAQGLSIPQQAVPSSTRTLPVRPAPLLAPQTGVLLPLGSSTGGSGVQALTSQTSLDTSLQLADAAGGTPAAGTAASDAFAQATAQQPTAAAGSTPAAPEAGTPKPAKAPAELPLLDSLERLAAGFASTLTAPGAGILLSPNGASSWDAEVASITAGLNAGAINQPDNVQLHQRILAVTQQRKPAPAPAKPAAKQAQSSAATKQAAKPPPRLASISTAAARIAQQQPDFDEDYVPPSASGAFQVPDAPPAGPVGPSEPQEPSAPLYITPPASFESLTEVNLDQPLMQIPQSFLGISHEWTHVEEINNIPGYKDIIRLLTSYGSGPFNIRVGGGSTDKQAYVFPQYVYDALRQVHEETGAVYILGLNFEKGDVELARAQLKMAKDTLPPESIAAIEIGNEPNFYEGTKKNMTALHYVRCCYVSDWAAFAKSLACPCGTWDCCEYGQFAGPVWGHVNVYPTTLKWFLDVNHKFNKLTTLHWYKATKETYNTPITLLEEAPIRKEMDNLRALVQTSQGYGIPLRVAESNTISNSGRVGVSNVFAATLWTLDGAFEVAATGAVGINFHQGSGQNLYTSILRWYNQNKLSPPVLRPPFYGMVMFQQAVGTGSKLLAKTQVSGDSSNFKVWPLLDVGSKELRFVVVNKHPSRAGTQVIRINRGWGYNTPAVVMRLVARGEDPLSATSGITLGGYYYAVGGVQKGADASELVPFDNSSGLTSWRVYMPPGSAALVRVKLVNA